MSDIGTQQKHEAAYQPCIASSLFLK